MDQTMLNAVWEQILDNLQKSVAEVVCKQWIRPLLPLSMNEDIFELGAPNDFHREWVESRYLNIIKDSVVEVTQKNLNIVLKNLNLKSSSEPVEEQQILFSKDKPDSVETSDGQEKFEHLSKIAPGDASTLNPRYTFESFVTGNSNRFAHAAALAVAESPGTVYNPFFIYGGVGLGKTHLMHAIGHEILKRNPEMSVLYISSEKFTNELINSIRNNTTEEFRQKYRKIDVLLVDDMQFLYKKVGTQEEFFHTFNALYDAKKQIILSSDRPPREIETLEERLRSRFEWGLQTDIQAPDLETRVAILKKKAVLENISVPNDALFYIASRIDSNIRELEGALTRVVAYSSINNQPITTELVSEAMNAIYPKERTQAITIELIQEIVAAYYSLDVKELSAKKRTRELAFPRQIAMYLCRKLTDYSLPQIGNEFGGRDHTTVLHACEKIDKDRQEDTKLDAAIKELMQRIQKM